MTKKTAWSHLPNAVHIDRVLASAKAHPKAWAAAWEVAPWEAWEAPWEAAWEVAWEVAVYSAREAPWDAARKAAAGHVATSAILALIAWDHSAKFLDMTPNELKMWQALSEDPAALLLLPAVVAFEQIAELELV